MSIYNSQSKLYRTMERVEDSNHTDHNIGLLIEFKEEMEAEGLSIERINRYMNSLLALQDEVGWPLDEPKDHLRQLKKLVARINKSRIVGYEMSPWTRREYKMSLLKLYQFVTGEDKPEFLEWMSVKVKVSERSEVNPSRLPHPSWVEKVATNANNVRDTALVLFLWDSGGRIGEVLDLRWNQLAFFEDRCEATIQGKTGERTLPLNESVSALRKWKYEDHRHKGRKYVFHLLNDRESQLGYKSARKQIGKAVDQAPVSSRIKQNPQAFRQGRATFLAQQGLTAPQLCSFMGWRSLETARYYINLAQSDLEEAVGELELDPVEV